MIITVLWQESLRAVAEMVPVAHGKEEMVTCDGVLPAGAAPLLGECLPWRMCGTARAQRGRKIHTAGHSVAAQVQWKDQRPGAHACGVVKPPTVAALTMLS